MSLHTQTISNSCYVNSPYPTFILFCFTILQTQNPFVLSYCLCQVSSRTDSRCSLFGPLSNVSKGKGDDRREIKSLSISVQYPPYLSLYDLVQTHVFDIRLDRRKVSLWVSCLQKYIDDLYEKTNRACVEFQQFIITR